MGGGGRSDIGWVGQGRGPLGAYVARRRAMRQMRSAVEADLTERGLPIPPRPPISRKKISGLGLLCAVLLGLLVGLVLWKLI